MEASPEQVAYRVVGAMRILVQYRKQELRVLVQCRKSRHWMPIDAGGGVRYLNGVLRDMDGSWIIAGCGVAALDNVASCLPTAYLHLLALDSGDWHILLGRKKRARCRG